MAMFFWLVAAFWFGAIADRVYPSQGPIGVGIVLASAVAALGFLF